MRTRCSYHPTLFKELWRKCQWSKRTTMQTTFIQRLLKLSIVSANYHTHQIFHHLPCQVTDAYSFIHWHLNFTEKLYYRKARSKGHNEKRFRNIKLNQFLSIPDDRRQSVQSSYAFLTNSTRMATSFVIYTVRDASRGKQLIDIHSKDVACIFGMSEERTAVKAKACREDVPNMKWDLIPNTYGDYWIQQQGTKLCLAPVLTLGKPVLIQLLQCNRWDPFMIWEIQDAYLYFWDDEKILSHLLCKVGHKD